MFFSPQPEGGYTATSPLLPELVTEGDSLEEVLEHAKDALAAVVETYAELGRQLPKNGEIQDSGGPVWQETDNFSKRMNEPCLINPI